MRGFRFLLLLISGLIFLTSCGGGSGSGGGGNGIMVAVNPNSAQSIDMNQTEAITATVSGDSTGKGVNWTVSCPMGVNPCGGMAQKSSGSGVPNMFNAPPNVTSPETVTVTATSASDPSKSTSVMVTVNPTLALVNPSPAQPQPGSVGQPFSFNLAAFVQGGSSPFNWTMKSGTLPAGLSLAASTGVISGSPTAASATRRRTQSVVPESSAAPVSLVFTCTDSGNPKISVDVSISITINSQSGGALAITSAPPPTGTAGTPYDVHILPCKEGSPGCVCRPFGCFRSVFGFVLTATGGVPPYSWTWTNAADSSLPAGLSVSTAGLIGGTPTTAETYKVIVTVNDSESPALQASANYSIVINLPPPPAINTTPAPYSPALKIAYDYTFAASSALTPLKWSETGALPPGLTFSNAGVLSGTPTMTGAFPISVTAQDSAGQNSEAVNFTIQVFPHGFEATGSMETVRDMQTATLLNNGKVLVAGGDDQEGDISATVELFDPINRTFAPTGSMAIARFNFTATLLNNGKVLVTGGGTASAELFDPASGGFALTGTMETPRLAHTATLLSNGKVLIAGGTDNNGNPLATAELYDSATGTFTPLSNMSAARAYFATVLLSTGKVLLIGGRDATGNSVTTAELFDPTNGTFMPTGSMSTPRNGHTATLLCDLSSASCNDNRVLVAGGVAGTGTPVATAELFDPTSGTFALTGTMTVARAMHTATMLNDGTVLLTGPDQTAELFDPNGGSFASTGTMTTARASHTATLLSDGSVLITGGHDVDASSTVRALSSAELYQ